VRGETGIISQDMKTANRRPKHNAGRFYDEALKSLQLIEIYVRKWNKRLNARGCMKVG
jgi:hypothetical protein